MTPRVGVAVVLGAHSEIAKLAEVIRLLGPLARVFHTGQHDATQSQEAWSAMGLPTPERVLAVADQPRARQVAAVVTELDDAFSARPPAAVLVQGDTNATLAGALAANAHGIPLVHVEAGLRSFDRAMPEEHNRVLVDHIADVLCVPTTVNWENLRAENVAESRIHVTGNTVVETVEALLPPRTERRIEMQQRGLRAAGFVLAMLHLPEHTEDPRVFATLLTELGRIRSTVVLPMAPRTVQWVHDHGLQHLLAALTVVEPLTHPQFLTLAAECAAIVSDSRGVEEECSVLKRPLLVVRRSTERPEVLGTFAERTTPGPEISEVVNGWLAEVPALHVRLERLPSPYGDGAASRRVAQLVRDLLAQGSARVKERVPACAPTGPPAGDLRAARPVRRSPAPAARAGRAAGVGARPALPGREQ